MVGNDYNAESKDQLYRQTLSNKERLSLIEEELDGVVANVDIFKTELDIFDLQKRAHQIDKLDVNQNNKIKELFSRNYKVRDAVMKLTTRVETLEKQIAELSNPQKNN